jgi:hypothetical protein
MLNGAANITYIQTLWKSTIGQSVSQGFLCTHQVCQGRAFVRRVSGLPLTDLMGAKKLRDPRLQLFTIKHRAGANNSGLVPVQIPQAHPSVLFHSGHSLHRHKALSEIQDYSVEEAKALHQ